MFFLLDPNVADRSIVKSRSAGAWGSFGRCADAGPLEGSQVRWILPSQTMLDDGERAEKALDDVEALTA